MATHSGSYDCFTETSQTPFSKRFAVALAPTRLSIFVVNGRNACRRIISSATAAFRCFRPLRDHSYKYETSASDNLAKSAIERKRFFISRRTLGADLLVPYFSTAVHLSIFPRRALTAVPGLFLNRNGTCYFCELGAKFGRTP